MTENRINEDPEEFRETLKLRDGLAFVAKQIKVTGPAVIHRFSLLL